MDAINTNGRPKPVVDSAILWQPGHEQYALPVQSGHEQYVIPVQPANGHYKKLVQPDHGQYNTSTAK